MDESFYCDPENLLHSSTKICEPYSVIDLNQAPMFEWCVIRLDIRMDTQQDMCSKEIGLHVQKLSSTPDSIVNTIGGLQYSFKELAHMHFQKFQYSISFVLMLHRRLLMQPKFCCII
jgi:hypothetical protein